jgi:hypothetical protein
VSLCVNSLFTFYEDYAVMKRAGCKERKEKAVHCARLTKWQHCTAYCIKIRLKGRVDRCKSRRKDKETCNCN